MYWLEVIGGARRPPLRAHWLVWCWPVLWLVLVFLVVAFGGRSTKFIYVDF